MSKKSPRIKCYTLLAVGKKQLGWDDEFYRDVFLVKYGATKVNGRVSASTLEFGKLHEAVEAMKRSGFKPVKKGASSRMSDWRVPRIKKITALWFSLHKAEVIKNPSEIAMQKWCASITKKAKLEWATATDLNNCIEALKSWAHREHVKLEH